MKKLDDYLVDITSDDEKVRLNAVMALGDLDDEAAIAVLSRLKVDKSSAVRFYVKKSILKLTTKFQVSEEAFPVRDISEENNEKILKLKNIEKIKDRSKIDKIFADLSAETDALVRGTMVGVLGKLCDDKHIDRIGEFTNDPDSRIVANAVEALEAIGSEKTIDILTRLLFHDDSRVKANVCKALWKFADKKKDIGNMVMARLRELMTSDKPWIRSSAMYVLSEIKTEEAIDLIKTCRNDPEKIIKDQAVETLKKIGYVDAPPPLSKEQQEKLANLEELPPDDAWPKVIFYSKKFAKFAGEKFDAVREYLSDDDNRDRIKRYSKYAAISFVAMFFFSAVFNALWELRYPPPAEVKKAEVRTETMSVNLMEAAADLKDLKIDESIRKLKLEIDKNPGDPMTTRLLAVAYNQKALRQLQNGAKAEAAQTAGEATRLAPEFTDAYLTLARAKAAGGDHDGAVASLRAGIQQNPRNPGLHIEQGRILMSRGSYEEAAPPLQKAAELSPASADAHYALTRCLLARKDTEGARAAYAKAVLFDPSRTDQRREIAMKFNEYGMIPESIAELSRLAASNPKDSKVREALGNVYFRTSNYRGAAEEFKAIASDASSNYEVTFKIGLCYQAMENVDEMFRYVYKAMKQNPNFAEAYQVLGSIYEYKRNPAAAKTCYETVMRLNPAFPGSYLALAKMYSASNQAANAVTVLNSGLKAAPDNPELLIALGTAYIESKNMKSARETFTKLLALLENEKDTPAYRQISELISRM